MSKQRVIKPTKNGKFHAMGLVVDTFDEAIERCTRKGKGNYFLVYPSETVGNLDATFEVCGNPDFIKQFLS